MTTTELSSSLAPPSRKRQKIGEGDSEQTIEDPTTTARATEAEWRLYHPPKKKSFHIADAVIILSPDNHAPRRGTIVHVENHKIRVSVDEDSQKEAEEDGKTQTSNIEEFPRRKWNRIIPSLTTATLTSLQQQQRRIIITPETNFFRQLAYQTNDTDKILEIGCSTGETSRLFFETLNVKSWVGLDTSDEMIAKCQEKIDDAFIKKKIDKKNFHVAKADALVDPATAKKEATTYGDPTVILIDIGGNRECINVLRMLSWVQDLFCCCRFVIIKSRELVSSIKSSSMTSINQEKGGIIVNGNRWFLENKTKRQMPKHPLRAPLVLSPKDHQTPICRYYNYHKQGCLKGDDCDLDHEHCHACQQLGHTAKECPTLTAPS